VDKATKWIGEHFAELAEKEELAGFGDRYYFLYAVGRAGVVGDKREFGGVNWYEQGKRFLLAKQSREGEWGGRHGKLVSTSFAVLFLTQGRRTWGTIDPAILDAPIPAKDNP
jgi:hypothetical protein